MISRKQLKELGQWLSLPLRDPDTDDARSRLYFFIYIVVQELKIGHLWGSEIHDQFKKAINDLYYTAPEIAHVKLLRRICDLITPILGKYEVTQPDWWKTIVHAIKTTRMFA